MSVTLHYTDPETGDDETLDLTGWRFRVTLGNATLALRDIVPHLLQASIELALDDTLMPELAPRGVAPIAVSHVDGVPCVVAYVKPEERWSR